MEKKYRLTEETKRNAMNRKGLRLTNVLDFISPFAEMGKKLYRIEALRDFGAIKKGMKGGFVESEANLSHEGDCWIYNDAEVFDDAVVKDNARVEDEAICCGNAVICDNAVVTYCAMVAENAKVCEQAVVSGGEVKGSAVIKGNGNVADKAIIEGEAEVFGIVKDSAWINGKAIIEGEVINRAVIWGDAYIAKGVTLRDRMRISNAYPVLYGKVFSDREDGYFTPEIRSNSDVLCLAWDNEVVTAFRCEQGVIGIGFDGSRCKVLESIEWYKDRGNPIDKALYALIKAYFDYDGIDRYDW